MATSIDTLPKLSKKFHIWSLLIHILLICCCFAQLARGDMSEIDVENVVKEPQVPDVELQQKSEKNEIVNKDFYSFSVEDHLGQSVPLKKYRNKVTLVVNVASQCGFTDGHYKALIRMKNILAIEDKFEVLAFPCNQFGAQEPRSNEDIQRFVKEMYHVNFPVFGKINVLGEDVPEAYHYLIYTAGVAPNWNFWKYLVNDKGQVVNSWGPRTSVEEIFHQVKEVVDNIGYDQPSYKQRHARSEGEL